MSAGDPDFSDESELRKLLAPVDNAAPVFPEMKNGPQQNPNAESPPPKKKKLNTNRGSMINEGPIWDYSQQQGFINQFGPASQGGAANSIANNTMDAWARENYSRVSQAREERRMEHERMMKQMELDQQREAYGDRIRQTLGNDRYSPYNGQRIIAGGY
jgi:hypothetical protein